MTPQELRDMLSVPHVCTRTAHIFAKHNDTANVQIPHFNVEKEGYMPELGPFGGDDFNIDVCLDCGKIQNWKPITDQDLELVFESPNHEDADEDSEEEARQENEERVLNLTEPSTFSLKNVEQQRIEKLLTSHFGTTWFEDDEAMDIVRDERDSSNSEVTRCVCEEMLSRYKRN